MYLTTLLASFPFKGNHFYRFKEWPELNCDANWALAVQKDTDEGQRHFAHRDQLFRWCRFKAFSIFMILLDCSGAYSYPFISPYIYKIITTHHLPCKRTPKRLATARRGLLFGFISNWLVFCATFRLRWEIRRVTSSGSNTNFWMCGELRTSGSWKMALDAVLERAMSRSHSTDSSEAL